MAVVTKIRSAQTIGLECAKPGIRVFHLILTSFSPSQISGKFCCSAIPAACMPRNEGQGSLPSWGVEAVCKACAGAYFMKMQSVNAHSKQKEGCIGLFIHSSSIPDDILSSNTDPLPAYWGTSFSRHHIS